jgi:SET domain-containing protein
MKDTTNQFSFVLKPSSVEGVGVFSAHSIKKNAFLDMFPEDSKKHLLKNIPPELRKYVLHHGKYGYGPIRFNCIPVGWYLNHSDTPNAYLEDDNYYASRNIKRNEEITIDYNVFDE